MKYIDNENRNDSGDANAGENVNSTADPSHLHAPAANNFSDYRGSDAYSVMELSSSGPVMPKHMQLVLRAGLFAQVFLMIMTFVSVIIATLPYYSYNTLTLRDLHIFIWMDFFITYLFLCDLAMRYFLRDKDKVPTAWMFFKRNWADGLALFTDIPVRGAGLSL